MEQQIKSNVLGRVADEMELRSNIVTAHELAFTLNLVCLCTDPPTSPVYLTFKNGEEKYRRNPEAKGPDARAVVMKHMTVSAFGDRVTGAGYYATLLRREDNDPDAALEVTAGLLSRYSLTALVRTYQRSFFSDGIDALSTEGYEAWRAGEVSIKDAQKL